MSKIESVEAYTFPHTKRDITTFLGLTGYNGRFIPYYAAIASVLMDVTELLS